MIHKVITCFFVLNGLKFH